MIGERGGRTTTAAQGFAAIEEFKATIADQVRADILGWLESNPEWHRDNLRIQLSAEDKNSVGAVVNGLIRSGVIVETGERRRSADPASHGRKSNVYRLAGGGGITGQKTPTTASYVHCDAAFSGQRPDGDTVSPRGASPGGVDMASSGPPRLFEVDDTPADGGSYYEKEAA